MDAHSRKRNCFHTIVEPKPPTPSASSTCNAGTPADADADSKIDLSTSSGPCPSVSAIAFSWSKVAFAIASLPCSTGRDRAMPEVGGRRSGWMLRLCNRAVMGQLAAESLRSHPENHDGVYLHEITDTDTEVDNNDNHTHQIVLSPLPTNKSQLQPGRPRTRRWTTTTTTHIRLYCVPSPYIHIPTAASNNDNHNIRLSCPLSLQTHPNCSQAARQSLCPRPRPRIHPTPAPHLCPSPPSPSLVKLGFRRKIQIFSVVTFVNNFRLCECKPRLCGWQRTMCKRFKVLCCPEETVKADCTSRRRWCEKVLMNKKKKIV